MKIQKKVVMMNRIPSVDIIRLFAIIGVIAIHTAPFRIDPSYENELYRNIDILINQLARFGVPFFFVISGYFWGVKVRGGEAPISVALTMAKRIGIVFLAWSFIYCLPYNVGAFYDYGVLGPIKTVYWNLAGLIEHPVFFIMQGTKIHLWFLIGLLCSLGISAVFVHKGWMKSLVVVSIALYVMGVLGKAYTDTPISFEIAFNTRNGPFFGTLFFVSGYLMSGFTPNTRWLVSGGLIAFLGGVIHFSEVYFLWELYGTYPNYSYVFGTYLMGIGMAMVGLSNHPSLQNKTLSTLGGMTLGVYAMHLIYADIFSFVDSRVDSPYWEVGYVFLVLVLTLASVAVISKNKTLRKIVI